jgi:hypothetical protein
VKRIASGIEFGTWHFRFCEPLSRYCEYLTWIPYLPTRQLETNGPVSIDTLALS